MINMIDFAESLKTYISNNSCLNAEHWVKRAYFDEENNLIYLEVVELFVKQYFKYAFDYFIVELLKNQLDFPELKIVQIDSFLKLKNESENDE